MPKILIGWSEKDTTPDKPTDLRGQFRQRISTHVQNPITATALAMEAGGEQAVMVSCDRVGISGEAMARLRDAIGPRIPDFDVTKLLVSATHTHDAPCLQEGLYPPPPEGVMTPSEYADFFVERVADAIVEAWQTRKPGGVSWAFGHAVVGHNRRAVYRDGTAKMYGKTSVPEFECIEGYEDHSVDMLFLWDEQQSLTGVVMNLACPSQVNESDLFISADYWHETKQEIRKRHGDGVFLLGQCSAAGDQSPHFLLYSRAEEEMRKRRGLTEREEIGRRLANTISDVIELAKDEVHVDVALAHVAKTVDLPAREITQSEYDHAKSEHARLLAQEPKDDGQASSRFVHLRRNMDVIDRYEAQQTNATWPVELHVLRIGDVAFATNPFEMFMDYGLRMKARSAAVQTFIIQLACDCAGYLPTDRAIAGQGYGAEAPSNKVGPEGGKRWSRRQSRRSMRSGRIKTPGIQRPRRRTKPECRQCPYLRASSCLRALVASDRVRAT